MSRVKLGVGIVLAIGTLGAFGVKKINNLKKPDAIAAAQLDGGDALGDSILDKADLSPENIYRATELALNEIETLRLLKPLNPKLVTTETLDLIDEKVAYLVAQNNDFNSYPKPVVDYFIVYARGEEFYPSALSVRQAQRFSEDLSDFFGENDPKVVKLKSWLLENQAKQADQAETRNTNLEATKAGLFTMLEITTGAEINSVTDKGNFFEIKAGDITVPTPKSIWEKANLGPITALELEVFLKKTK